MLTSAHGRQDMYQPFMTDDHNSAALRVTNKFVPVAPTTVKVVSRYKSNFSATLKLVGALIERPLGRKATKNPSPMEKAGGASPSPTVNGGARTNGSIKTIHSGSSFGTFLSRKVRKKPIRKAI